MNHAEKLKIKDAVLAANEQFEEEGADFLATIDSYDTMRVSIYIEWGDWKHEHGYADYVMREHGFTKTDEIITEEDGSDCFSSVHVYNYAVNTSRKS